jgi:hypothetical protein
MIKPLRWWVGLDRWPGFVILPFDETLPFFVELDPGTTGVGGRSGAVCGLVLGPVDRVVGAALTSETASLVGEGL